MIDTYLREIHPKLESLRKIFHANPELSEQEFTTSTRIIDYLKGNTDAEIKKIGKTGVIAIFNTHHFEKTILLRADMDALPIEESNDFEHRSIHKGISHKCGHDGHTTILLGLAETLQHYPIKGIRIILLWQPAEENGMGAKEVLSDSNFMKLKIDYVFALHNLPGFKKNTIVIRNGFFTAHVKSMIIRLQGKTAHAAEPENGYNPALAISEIIQECNRLTINIPEKENFFLITPVYISMGDKAHGISAGDGEIHLTLRSWSPRIFNENCEQLIHLIHNISSEYHLKTDISWTQEFHANKNDINAVDNLLRVVKNQNMDHQIQNFPFKWGEDFGLFTQQYKGAMFGLGAGEHIPALHNPDYDFPDEIITQGIQMFYYLIKEVSQ